MYIFDKEYEKTFYGLFKYFFVYLYMASRESYSIRREWNDPSNARHRRFRTYPSFRLYSKREKFKLRIISVYYYTIRKFILGNKYDRTMFWLDNVTIPYNKIIGCKLRGKHKWYYLDDDEEAFCTKCHKRSGYISRSQWTRVEKLKEIKKRINK